MSTQLNHVEPGRFARFGGFFNWSGQSTDSHDRRYLWLPILLAVALAGGLMWFSYDSDRAESEAVEAATARNETSAPSPATVVAPSPVSSDVSSIPASPDDRAVTTADAPPQFAGPPPINGLSISSQSWHWGGLGSKALVTLTLRNNNDYAVKDIELLCAFVRRDGSHLTDRKRVIPDTVNMKSRKTFTQMLIGFVNINASRAKCTAVAANRS